jgi:deoxyadenosine/deoxycytidine kinase
VLGLRDYRAYRELYDLVIGTLPPPDLLVYLQASVPTLMERIGKRGRGIESGITADYLERLGALYTEWINDFNLCPVLTVPADDLDFQTRDPFADHLRSHSRQTSRQGRGCLPRCR